MPGFSVMSIKLNKAKFVKMENFVIELFLEIRISRKGLSFVFHTVDIRVEPAL